MVNFINKITVFSQISSLFFVACSLDSWRQSAVYGERMTVLQHIQVVKEFI